MASVGSGRPGTVSRLAAGLVTAGLLLVPVRGASASTPSPATAAADAKQLFQLLNRERAAHGLAAMHWSTRLTSAAHTHNLRMAKYNTLSHQLAGEHPLGYRVTVTGYRWRALAENLGWTSDWSAAAILTVQRNMYREVAPNDGHRANILSRTLHDVGIDVVMDAAHHKAWLTVDFGAAA
jgi:uncharacterized protein YkwD